MKWVNFLVSSKFSKNTEGHLSSSSLAKAIKIHDGKEAYYCTFDCVESQLKIEINTGEKDSKGKPVYDYVPQPHKGSRSFAQYSGTAKPALGFVQFDFDSTDHTESFKDAANFIEDHEIETYSIAFSGSKGYHVAIPFELFGLSSDALLAGKLKQLAVALKELYPTLDTGVYNVNRKFRVLNTKHPKTGFYKTLLPKLICPENLSCFKRRAKTFYPPIPKGLKPNEHLTTALEASAREVAEVTSDKDDQTNFEKYDQKLCIRRMFKRRCDEGEKNNTALILINDMYKVGVHQEKAETAIKKWAAVNGHDTGPVLKRVSDIYRGRAYYNHGCQDALKAAQCSAKCKLYRKLDPKKRPEVADSTKADMNDAKLKEFECIEQVMSEMFGYTWSINKKAFTGDGLILKQGRDLFYHKTTHWEHLDDNNVDRIKSQIGVMYDYGADYSRIDKTFKSFLINCPFDPSVDFFKPHPWAANFINGTLHLVEDRQSGAYDLQWREHEKRDYITNLIPFEYDSELVEVNTEFEGMLKRIFKGDPDVKEKIRSVSQMYGACLMPAFPHLFFIHGKALSGKSTICLVLEKLLQKENICGVQPHELNGFHMAGMAGKLVNLVTDINANVVITDDVIKQIEDRKAVRIQRKNREDIYAPLPAIHIFGANDLPKTFDGSNHTHDRRWSIIVFNNLVKGKYMRNYAQWCFNQNPQGVLNFAIRGLRDLVVQSGHFLNPPSGKTALAKWQTENDVVQCFLDDIQSGEASAAYKDGSTLPRAAVWEIFKDWLEESRGRNIKFNKHTFYKIMGKKGYEGDIYTGIKAAI